MISPDAGADAADGDMPEAGPELRSVHFVGRLDGRSADGPIFEWAGVSIRARFTGTGLRLRMRGMPNQFQVTVDADSRVLAIQEGVDSYALATNLGAGEHEVTLTRRTEALFGATQFLGFEVEGGALVPTPVQTGRHIEFIGDSITNGYGNEGADGTCRFSADTQNEGRAFGAFTAQDLNATHTALAWSGRGLRVNYGNAVEDVVPLLFGRNQPSDADYPWAFPAPAPDVVVIHLGTNDTWNSVDPGESFTADYVTFLERIRQAYPSAHLFAVAAPERPGVVTRAREAVDARRSAGDSAVHAFVFDAYDVTNGYGCDHHPSVAAHRAMADKLVPAIRAVMDW